MPYVPNCCCDRDGLCTTRWYPLTGVSYFGNPDDAYEFDHGTGTSKVATIHDGDNWYNFVLGDSKISKVPIPDGANPIAAWTRSIFYTPPGGAVGTAVEQTKLAITEMRTVDTDTEHSVVIGARIAVGLTHSSGRELKFEHDIIQVDRSSYGSAIVRTAMAANDEVSKFDLGYRPSNMESGYSGFREVSTGGFFRCEVNQWLGEQECGSVGFQNDDSVGTVAWTFPEGAIDSGNGEAFASGSGEVSNYLRGYFNLTSCFPGGVMSIDGLALSVTRRASDDGASAFVRDDVVQFVVDGIISGQNKANTSDKWETTTETMAYGDSTDLWGMTLTADQVALIGVVIQVEFGHNGADAFVDLVGLTVYYTDNDGDPQVTTINTPISVTPGDPFANYENRGRARNYGLESTFLTEPIPLDVSGADLATILQSYLDPVYSVSGTGEMSESSDITITVTHDGSIDSSIAAPGGRAANLVGISVVHAFPDEASSVHMLDINGAIVWSRCGCQNAYFDGYGGAGGGGPEFFEPQNRRVDIIGVDPLYERISTFGGWSYSRNGAFYYRGGNYPVNVFDFDGSPVDNGAYARLQGYGHSPNQRNWRIHDVQGYGYSQLGIEQGRTADPRIDFTLVRYGPAGPDAAYEVDWTCPLEFEVFKFFATDDAVIVGGSPRASGRVFIALINVMSGAIGWQVELETHKTGVSRGESYLNDIWTDKFVVSVAAYYGVYEFDYTNGDLWNYYPHGAPCMSAMRISTGEVNYLVLTGGTSPIDIDPAYYDIDPETLT